MSGEDTNGLLSFVHKVEIRKFLNLLYLHEDNAMKKIVSLLLVVVLVFTFMAVSVSAATNSSNCSGCGAPPQSLATENRVYTTTRRADNCSNNSTVHNHTEDYI